MARWGMGPGWQVHEEQYPVSDRHASIGLEDSPGNTSLDNIGKNGSNLTIAVLSMNRSELTLRLYHSIVEKIPGFQGQLLIGDNGSCSEELDKLERALVYTPFKCRILKFGTNYGVGGGRNKLFAEVETDWIMSLDNDMVFTSNPLPQIQRDINMMGDHFLSLPFVNADNRATGMYGGHLYLEAINGRPAIGIGSAYVFNDAVQPDVPHDGFLCSGVPGGAAIFNKHRFSEMGGFDEGMFVGFEDVEFSIRLFQKGYKAGACGMISLLHDHPKSTSKNDEDYEKVRFSNTKIYESAMYFEKKHGFSVWNDAVAEWLDMRQRQTYGADSEGAVQFTKKKKIALAIDRTNWALDHVADQIIRNLSDEFDFIRIYGTDIDNFSDVLLLSEKCDIVHVMWRGHLASFNGEYCQTRIKNLGMTREEFMKRYVDGKVISTEVYDHLLLEGQESEFTLRLFVDEDAVCTNYAVSSKKLWKIYQELPGLRLRPQAVCQDGVDLEVFRPIHLERLKTAKNRTVRFGWVGNSKWLVGDLKGINTIIKPAIKGLQDEGYDIELITSDRQNKLIPHEEMPDFYAQLDCYLCASSCEGTPNPILEAMACGLPVITTDVGLVPEVFGEKQMEYVLEERTVECMKEKIKKLLNTDGSFEELSQENLQSIQNWDWKIMTENFRTYFRDCLKQR